MLDAVCTRLLVSSKIVSCQVALQARIVAYSDSDEEDFNLHKWPPGAESDSEDEHRASPVDRDTATVNVKQKQLIRKPPPGNKVSIGSGPGVAAVAEFCGHHVAPNLHRAVVPENAVRVSHPCCTRATSLPSRTRQPGLPMPQHQQQDMLPQPLPCLACTLPCSSSQFSISSCHLMSLQAQGGGTCYAC